MVRLLILLGLSLFVSACASDPAPKPKHPSDHKWWQGDMDNQDRAFFIDSIFTGR